MNKFFRKKNIEERLDLFFYGSLIKKFSIHFPFLSNFNERKKYNFQKNFLPISATTFNCLKNILNECIEKMCKMINKKKHKNNFLDIPDLVNIDFLQFFYSTEDLFLFRKIIFCKIEKSFNWKKFLDRKKNISRISKTFFKIKN
nr:hypothetical protein CparaKRNrm3_p119 [Cryptomonas paramecium]